VAYFVTTLLQIYHRMFLTSNIGDYESDYLQFCTSYDTIPYDAILSLTWTGKLPVSSA